MLWNWNTAFAEMEALRRQMDSVFDHTQRYYTGGNVSFPLLNIYDHEDRVSLVTEVPGVRQQDLEISFIEGALKLKGERKSPELEAEDKVTQLRHERRLGAFEKTIRIPVDVNPDAIEARLQDGVLTIDLPKAEKARTRQIAIQSV